MYWFHLLARLKVENRRWDFYTFIQKQNDVDELSTRASRIKFTIIRILKKLNIAWIKLYLYRAFYNLRFTARSTQEQEKTGS